MSKKTLKIYHRKEGSTTIMTKKEVDGQRVEYWDLGYKHTPSLEELKEDFDIEYEEENVTND